MNPTYFFYDSVASTNDEAKKAASLGCKSPAVFCAARQTGGRGRNGRSWASPAGGLFMSILIEAPGDLRDAGLVPLASAVGVAKCLRAEGIDAAIKWPNDVLVGGKKICGILCEGTFAGDGARRIVIGIGLNVNVDCGSLPEEVRSTAISMIELTGLRRDIRKMAQAVAEPVLFECDRLLSGKRDEVLAAWRQMNIVTGRPVTIYPNAEEPFVGIAVDVDEDGALIVDSGGSLVRVLAGDVSVRLA